MVKERSNARVKRSTNITPNMGNRVSTVKNNFRDFHSPCMSIPPNSTNLETGANAYRNSLGNEKSRQYQEYLQLNARKRNFREYNFYNFGYIWRGCPRSQKFRGENRFRCHQPENVIPFWKFAQILMEFMVEWKTRRLLFASISII